MFAAQPPCPDAQPVRTVLAGQGRLESVIATSGVLYFTDQTSGAVMRLDAPNTTPVLVASGIDAPGGMLAEPDGSLIVGDGDSAKQGTVGGGAGLLHVDPASGRTTTLATGLGMANGLARDPSGAIYASNDVRGGIDKVTGDQVQRDWADTPSANGLAVDSTGRYLFANETFQPAVIERIDLADPTSATDYANPADSTAGLDGLTIDEHDRLFAAANRAGEIYRVDTDQHVCALASGLNMPSAVAFGAGGAFPRQNLYAVTFNGDVVELPNARPVPAADTTAPARLRIIVRPRTIRPYRTTRVTITVRRAADGQSRVEPGALVRVSNRRGVTGYDGRVRLKIRAHRRGTIAVRVSAAGLKAARASLRVR